MASATLSLDVLHTGTNFARLEGFRLVVQALDGKIEWVHLVPDEAEWWRVIIEIEIAPNTADRCVEIARKLFDGTVNFKKTVHIP